MYLFLWCKAEFSASHDLSEINLICLDLLLKDIYYYYAENSCAGS